MSAVYEMKDVATHNTAESAWTVIDGIVYDITKFSKFHPGGSAIILQYAGKDATEAFFDMHRSEVLYTYKRLKIGTVSGVKSPGRAVADQAPGTLSLVPYGEHNSLQGWYSPYYTEDHKRFRIAVRKWYDETLRPDAVKFANANKRPTLKHFQAMGAGGILATHLAPSPLVASICRKVGIPMPGGLQWEQFDYFMEQIVHEEHSRLATPGFVDGLCAGYDIAAPCLVAYGTPKMQQEVLPEVLLGNKRICLAISEPFAGSDVAGLKTTATRTADGKHFVVNGIKKWITGGVDSDYFVTAVRTGGEGIKGISMLLIERSEGLQTKLIKTSYSASAGTAYITMDNVLVPVENILGRENQGFKCIMNNFNHERWMIVVNTLAASRDMVRESILWAKQRKVFGRPLMSQPIIQSKISEMAAQVEAATSWLDSVTFQMQNLPHDKQGSVLAGPIGLLKFYSTRVSLLVADHSSQVFGGRAITRSGMGQRVERFARAVKYGAIYGGSEEIMVGLAAKQMLKRMPRHSRL